MANEPTRARVAETPKNGSTLGREQGRRERFQRYRDTAYAPQQHAVAATGSRSINCRRAGLGTMDQEELEELEAPAWAEPRERPKLDAEASRRSVNGRVYQGE